jgi:sugar lactone lactonase YvrE
LAGERFTKHLPSNNYPINNSKQLLMKKYFTLALLLLALPQIHAQIIITAAGGNGAGFSGDGSAATLAQLYSPSNLTLDKQGNLYVCDKSNARIRKLTPAYNGTISTVAGNGTVGYSGDGFEAVYAEISGLDVAIDLKGNLFISDGSYHRVRKVSPSGIITTYAGTGVAGYNGDGIAATTAMLNVPIGVAVDDTGNLFIAERDNYRIRKVDTFGIITTVAGNGIPGYSPDGSIADTSRLNYPLCLRTDKNGTLFFSDNARLRKLEEDGTITTIAGTGTFGFSGDGSMATAANIDLVALSIDTFGNCYIADPGTKRIRKIGTDGIITTIAGTGVSGYSGDWGDPLLAKLGSPGGLAVAPIGDVFIGDVQNNRVRMITTHVTTVPDVAGNEDGIYIYPNPAQQHFTILIKAAKETIADVVITNQEGKEVARKTIKTNNPTLINVPWPSGIYLVNASMGGNYYTSKIEIK